MNNFPKDYLTLVQSVILLLLNVFISNAQHTLVLDVSLDSNTQTLSIQQELEYVNNSNKPLKVIYFNDWANAYSSKNTPLAKRFAEQFKKGLHLAKKNERGSTKIVSFVDSDYRGLEWSRTKNKDIIKVELNHELAPNAVAKFYISYNVKLPPNKYTPYGYNNKGEYYLKDWYLTPAVFDGVWHLYSNKDLEDLYTDYTNTTINLTYPKNLFLSSNYGTLSKSDADENQFVRLDGSKQKNCEIILSTSDKFTTLITKYATVVSDLDVRKLDPVLKTVSINNVVEFINAKLGNYPHTNLLVSEIDYDKNPLYGINQLPSFIQPYNVQFQFEMKFLKTALINILEETIYVNPRKKQWLTDAIANYLMIAYVEEFYPDQKLLGKLSRIWGVKSFNLAKMGFNEQYSFLHMITARKNLDQPLTTSNDSLIWFNQKIGNKYKAGLGLSYLASYMGDEVVNKSIKDFYKSFMLTKVHVSDFESILKRSTDENIDWFFRDYVSTDRKIDFKIKKIEKTADSLTVTLKNKEGTNVPISLFGLRKDSVVSQYWFSDILKEKTFTIPRNGENRLVLNYDKKIPEFNQRDNWKSLGGFLASNKKLKFTFFQDSENPYYNQIFYVPTLSFNLYDGWVPALRLHNKTLVERPFIFDIEPGYSFREKALVGGAGFNYRHYVNKSGLYLTSFGVGAGTSHFNINSRVTRIIPRITFAWRPENLLLNKRQLLNFRYVSIFRDIDATVAEIRDDDALNPDYGVFNMRFRHIDNNVLNFKSWFIDFQQSSNFTKLSAEYEYRKLFDNNRQLNIRFFAGKFLWNNSNSDFFSFALDRPTDYLFDFNYLGRSEDSGIYSQQIIIAEGGFKSFLNEDLRFSNDWIATMNASVNIWRWAEVYGDIGYIQNRGQSAKFVYDSGVRLNLVTDFFELYFPVYSNNGWEIAQPNYNERIRFIVTLSPKTIIRLFTRKWF